MVQSKLGVVVLAMQYVKKNCWLEMPFMPFFVFFFGGGVGEVGNVVGEGAN